MNDHPENYTVLDKIAYATRTALLNKMQPAITLKETIIDKDKKYIILTLDTADEGLEIGIRIINENGKSEYHPLQRMFSSKEEALSRHEGWVKFIEEGNRTIIRLSTGPSPDEEKNI